jgi:hypothetical protein
MDRYGSLRHPPRRTERRSSVRYLVTVLLTTGFVATRGLGAFPENPVTQAFQEEIGQNIPEPLLNPINSYLGLLSAPMIPPQPASASQAGAPDVIGFLLDSFAAETVVTQTASPESLIPTATSTITASPTSTPTLSVTPSSTLTQTSTVTASSTPTSTRTATPTFTHTPTPTDTATATPTATIAPFIGFTVSNVDITDDINPSGTSITVMPGQAFFVFYNFQVFSDPCLGCITQLVTGLGTPGSHGGSCAYDGIPGASPGVSGSENYVTLTAPSTPGTFPVVVEYHWQFGCADALANYGTGGAVPTQVIGQIIVP